MMSVENVRHGLLLLKCWYLSDVVSSKSLDFEKGICFIQHTCTLYTLSMKKKNQQQITIFLIIHSSFSYSIGNKYQEH